MDVLFGNSVGIAIFTLFLFYFSAAAVSWYQARYGKGRLCSPSGKFFCFAFLSAGLFLDMASLVVYDLLHGTICYHPCHLFAKLLLYSTVFLIDYFYSSGLAGWRSSLRTACASALYLFLLLFDMLAFHFFGCRTVVYMALSAMFYVAVVVAILVFVSLVLLRRYDSIVKTMQKKNMVSAIVLVELIMLLSLLLFVSFVWHSCRIWHFIFIALLFLLHACYFFHGCRCRKKQAARSVKPYRFKEEGSRFSGLVGDMPSGEYVIIQRLISYFESEKPYLDKNLKLETVSRILYTNKTYLSKALNQKMYRNFNQFVNRYRIAEACSIYLEKPSTGVNDLCDMAGFKNISSFCAAFNLNTGYTPAEWCKEVKRRLSNGENVVVEEYFIQRGALDS